MVIEKIPVTGFRLGGNPENGSDTWSKAICQLLPGVTLAPDWLFALQMSPCARVSNVVSKATKKAMSSFIGVLSCLSIHGWWVTLKLEKVTLAVPLLVGAVGK